MRPDVELARVVPAFEDAGLEYALCGGLALAVHGLPRYTDDIDVLVPPSDVERAVAVAATVGFDIRSGRITFGHGTPRESMIERVVKIVGSEFLTLDLMFVTPVFEPVWASRERLPWGDRHIWTVSKSGLVIMKRLADRPHDRADVIELLEEE